MNRLGIKSLGIVLTIFLLASGLRLFFLSRVPQPPVYYDAVSYLNAARNILS